MPKFSFVGPSSVAKTLRTETGARQNHFSQEQEQTPWHLAKLQCLSPVRCKPLPTKIQGLKYLEYPHHSPEQYSIQISTRQSQTSIFRARCACENSPNAYRFDNDSTKPGWFLCPPPIFWIRNSKPPPRGMSCRPNSQWASVPNTISLPSLSKDRFTKSIANPSFFV